MKEEQKEPQKVPEDSDSPARARLILWNKTGLKSYQINNKGINRKTATKRTMVEIHPEGHIKDSRDNWEGFTDIFRYIEKSKLLPENKELLSRFCRDAKIGKTIKKGAKKKIGKKRLAKYVQDLKKLDRFLKKPLSEATQEDLELFISELEDGNIQQKNGKPYAPETQIAIKKIIIKFYSWLHTGNTYRPELVEWIDTSIKLPDARYIKKEQLDQLLSILTSNDPRVLVRNRALLCVFFDSGARLDELYNMRLKHLEHSSGNYKVRIEFSKTKARTVSLPLYKEYLEAWLDIHPARDNPLAQLFPMTQNHIRQVTKRAGSIINEPRLTPHTLRKSAATYWAGKLNRYQLCSRMGWAMSSRQPDRYINIAGLDEQAVIDIVETEKVHKVEAENAQLNHRLSIMEDTLRRLMSEEKEELKKIIARIQENN